MNKIDENGVIAAMEALGDTVDRNDESVMSTVRVITNYMNKNNIEELTAEVVSDAITNNITEIISGEQQNDIMDTMQAAHEKGQKIGDKLYNGIKVTRNVVNTASSAVKVTNNVANTVQNIGNFAEKMEHMSETNENDSWWKKGFKFICKLIGKE